jgi:hypothetical protein
VSCHNMGTRDKGRGGPSKARSRNGDKEVLFDSSSSGVDTDLSYIEDVNLRRHNSIE